jgi:hypothetical protein
VKASHVSLLRTVALLVSLCSAAFVSPTAAQEMAKLTIKSTVITNDLSVKIVPKLALSIELENGTPLPVSTSLEGAATVDLPVGKYHVKSTRGVDFEAKHFDWDVPIDVKAGENQLELSSDNAKITVSDKPVRGQTNSHHTTRRFKMPWSPSGASLAMVPGLSSIRSDSY